MPTQVVPLFCSARRRFEASVAIGVQVVEGEHSARAEHASECEAMRISFMRLEWSLISELEPSGTREAEKLGVPHLRAER